MLKIFIFILRLPVRWDDQSETWFKTLFIIRSQTFCLCVCNICRCWVQLGGLLVVACRRTCCLWPCWVIASNKHSVIASTCCLFLLLSCSITARSVFSTDRFITCSNSCNPSSQLWLYAGLTGSNNPCVLKADLVVCANPSSSSWVWVGECFFSVWYQLTWVME